MQKFHVAFFFVPPQTFEWDRMGNKQNRGNNFAILSLAALEIPYFINWRPVTSEHWKCCTLLRVSLNIKAVCKMSDDVHRELAVFILLKRRNIFLFNHRGDKLLVSACRIGYLASHPVFPVPSFLLCSGTNFRKVKSEVHHINQLREAYLCWPAETLPSGNFILTTFIFLSALTAASSADCHKACRSTGTLIQRQRWDLTVG